MRTAAVARTVTPSPAIASAREVGMPVAHRRPSEARECRVAERERGERNTRGHGRDGEESVPRRPAPPGVADSGTQHHDGARQKRTTTRSKMR